MRNTRIVLWGKFYVMRIVGVDFVLEKALTTENVMKEVA